MPSGEMSSATVSLPGGLVVEEHAVLREAELRPLSGHEEDWLARNPGVPTAQAVTRLLGSCLVRLGDLTASPDLVRQLLVGDRDYLMLQLRRLTLGDEVQAVVACPECASKMDVTFKASEVPVERPMQMAPVHAVELVRQSGRKRVVRFRLPVGADQEAVLGLDSTSAVAALFDRCVLGKKPKLSLAERNQVIDAMEERAPQVELDLSISCQECGHNFVLPFDTTAFFLHEMRGDRQQLLREVHGLAFYYHWSEAEILGMERNRRRTYLSLLSDELHRN